MTVHPRDYPGFEAPDEDKIHLVATKRWHGQDDFYGPFERQLEENLRMVAGRHYDIYVEAIGRFVNVLEEMTTDERRWRQRPIFNWLGYWYMITHAKAIENPPVFSFLPATEDRVDHILAEIMDPVHKYLWDELDMPHTIDVWLRWVIATGSGILRTYWDPDAGDLEDFLGPARIPILDERGQPILGEQGILNGLLDEVPFGKIGEDEDGEPVIGPLVQPLPGGDFEIVGEPMQVPLGNVACEALSPAEVRSSAEPSDFHDKAWHVQRLVMHVDEIKKRYGVEVEPDEDLESNSTLEQIFFGLGHVGAAMGKSNEGTTRGRKEGFAAVYRMVEQPRTDVPDLDQGRELLVTRQDVLMDEPQMEPGRKEYHRLDFVVLPNRPVGKSPVEDMIQPQRSFNRGWGQIMEYRNLVANPLWLIDAFSGVDNIENIPGSSVKVRMRPGVSRPIQALEPPNLPEQVFEIQDRIKAEMEDMGSLRSGSEGRPPTKSASGEFVKELRFNDDRYLGPMLRRATAVLGRVVESWQPLLESGWSDERMIRVAGDETAARFVTVRPEMFKGRVNVKAVGESMLPESRESRQARLDTWLQMEVIDRKTYMDLYNHPHLGRAVRPGGVHRSMAEWEHSQMLQGMEVTPLEPHDDEIHLMIHEEFMASPEFARLDQRIQALFTMHVERHKQALRLQMAEQMKEQAQAAGAQAELAGAVATSAGAGAAPEGAAPPANENGAQPGAPSRARR